VFYNISLVHQIQQRNNSLVRDASPCATHVKSRALRQHTKLNYLHQRGNHHTIHKCSDNY